MSTCSSERPTPSIGVGVLVWRNKTLLLGKRLGENPCWQFPGGHLEAGETVLGCAAREVKEETGLEITALRHLGFTNETFEITGKPYLTLLVSADCGQGEAQVLEPDKCSQWQWYDSSELPSPLFEPIKLFLAQIAMSHADVDLYALHCSSPVGLEAQVSERI